MLGLIKKDLLLIKENLNILILMYVFYAFLAFQEIQGFVSIIVFASVVSLFTTFNYEAYNKWDTYAVTLPQGRKKTVAAKYLTSILVTLILSIVTLLLVSIFALINPNKFNLTEIIYTILVLFAVTLVIESLFYPFIYKFGIEKARIIFFIAIFGLAFLIYIFAQYINISIPQKYLTFFSTNYIFCLVIAMIIMIIIILLSYLISHHFYLKKEF